MDERRRRNQERMRQKQLQLKRRRMMKKVTYVLGAILLLVFVVRGVILPIVHRLGGGSAQVEKPADVQADADLVASAETKDSENTETENKEDAENQDGEEGENTDADANTEADAPQTTSSSGPTAAARQPLRGMSDIQKALVMTSGWHEDSTGKWYRNTDGTYYVSGFQIIDNNTYAFDDKGYVRTGWYIDGSREYYFNEDGTYDSTRRRPMLALTYDDGPGEYTETLLNCLEENGAKATFFMLGEHVREYPDEIAHMIRIGCELGNHSYNHPNLYEIGAEGAARQYAQTDDALMEVCGRTSTVARCPYGNGNSEIFAAVGKPFFMWSLDSLDWKYRDVDLDYDAVMNGDLTDGSIILMHDIHQASVQSSLRIIPDLIARGYRLVTVSELAEAKGVDLKYASYSDFWDSSLAAGYVAGYRGEGWNDFIDAEDALYGEDNSDEDGSDFEDEGADFEDDEYSEA